jgi:hypothetical protein
MGSVVKGVTKGLGSRCQSKCNALRSLDVHSNFGRGAVNLYERNVDRARRQRYSVSLSYRRFESNNFIIDHHQERMVYYATPEYLCK